MTDSRRNIKLQSEIFDALNDARQRENMSWPVFLTHLLDTYEMQEHHGLDVEEIREAAYAGARQALDERESP